MALITAPHTSLSATFSFFLGVVFVLSVQEVDVIGTLCAFVLTTCAISLVAGILFTDLPVHTSSPDRRRIKKSTRIPTTPTDEDEKSSIGSSSEDGDSKEEENEEEEDEEDEEDESGDSIDEDKDEENIKGEEQRKKLCISMYRNDVNNPKCWRLTYLAFSYSGDSKDFDECVPLYDRSWSESRSRNALRKVASSFFFEVADWAQDHHLPMFHTVFLHGIADCDIEGMMLSIAHDCSQDFYLLSLHRLEHFSELVRLLNSVRHAIVMVRIYPEMVLQEDLLLRYITAGFAYEARVLFVFAIVGQETPISHPLWDVCDMRMKFDHEMSKSLFKALYEKSVDLSMDEDLYNRLPENLDLSSSCFLKKIKKYKLLGKNLSEEAPKLVQKIIEGQRSMIRESKGGF